MHLSEKEYYKRLAIFCFYDKDGHVDDYVIFMLKAISEHFKDVTVVINGFATPDSERRLKLNSTQLIYRDNYGFDFAAYKQAVDETKNIQQYDEILFFNQTIFGPVFSLNTIFNTMSNKKKADFWSIVRNVQNSCDVDENSRSEESGGNAHRESEFIDGAFFVVKRRMSSSEHFKEYFDSLEFNEKSLYEPKKQYKNFTDFFADKGFNFTTYLNVEKFEEYTNNTSVDKPIELLKLGYPFFKRKALLKAYYNSGEGESTKKARELYDFIRTQTDYPVAFINKNLFKALPPAAIYKALALYEDVQIATGRAKRTAAVMWFATENLGEILCSGAGKMQKDISLLCLFANEKLRDKFLPKLPPKAQAIVTSENGFMHLFGKLWKDVSVFENILYCHNNLIFETNLLYAEDTLENILEALNPGKCGAILSERKDYGAFVPLPITSGVNLSAGMNWQEAKKQLIPLLENAQINVPNSGEDEGFANYGSMFFARTSAVENLSKFDFNDNLFIGAHAHSDYLIPLCVQNSGYHTVTACTSEQTFEAFTNSATALRAIIANCTSAGYVNSEITTDKIIKALEFYDEKFSEESDALSGTKQLDIKKKISKYIKKIAKK